MRTLIRALAILCAAPVAAQELADFQSRDFARTSHQALSTGDRTAALIAALKGLPTDLSQENLDRFQEAYDALVRAAVSRSVRLDLPVNSIFEFDATGSRLASVGFNPAADGDQSRTSLTLWDPQTGEKIADLLPIDALSDGSWSVQAPVFSPDGKFLVQMAPVEGVAVVFDALSGQEVVRLTGNDAGTLASSGGAAFSRDGGLLLTLGSEPTFAHLWNTSNWERIASAKFGDYTLLSPLDGGTDGIMHFTAGDAAQGFPPPTELWSISSDGAQLVHAFPNEPSGLGTNWGRIASDDADRLFALQTGNSDLAIFERATGTEVARLPASTIGQSMGIVAPSGDGVLLLSTMDALPRRLTFDGTDAPLQEVDKLLGIHAVFSLGGELIGFAPDLFAYLGNDMSRGPDLYREVMSTLPDETKAQIEAERIVLE